MIDALHISESGLKANQKWIDTISNNVANMQTVGFKKANVQFANLINNSTDQAGNVNPPGTSYGIGTSVGQVETVFTPGSFKATGQVLDVAINGAGFLEVIHTDGSLKYTRTGRLKVNNEGQLTTLQGLALSDDIRVPSDVTQIEIDKGGIVRGKTANSDDIIELGQIRVAQVISPESMSILGDGLYAVTEASGDANLQSAGTNGVGEIVQGYLEMSNVDLVEEMTNLVMAQRAYQLNARIIQTADQVMETINNLRR